MAKFKEIIRLIIYSQRRFLSLSMILAIMIFSIRIYELVITSNFSNYPHGSISNLLNGLKFDLILYLQISAILMIPFQIIVHFSHKTARFFFIFFSLLLVVADFMLLKYFATARVPLGADLLGYSFHEMKKTIGASGELSIFPYIVIIIFLLIMVRVFSKHVYYRLPHWLIALLTILMISSLLPIKQLKINPSKFDNEFSMYVTENKLGFFINSISQHYIHRRTLENEPFKFKINPLAGEDQFTFVHPEYPFLHQENTPDVLGSYFNLGDTPPNIVFIVVESLGRAYSGQGAYLGSFTPFLDSLMQKSLYWENCLSTSGRTFQVLPALLASLPFGDRGFAELGEKMPDHISLISLLKKQAGYTSSFVYGGEAEFDNMDQFMRRQGIDTIIDSHVFGSGYNKLPASDNGFSWGYGDREIFRKYLDTKISNSNKPSVDVMLTLAMHDPFNIPNQSYYDQKFEKRLKTLNLSAKTIAFNMQYHKQFASILYFDDSFNYFMKEISKHESFANTIFIITGDHRMPEIPISTQIDRFHVPLVIYSPMLKTPEKFSAITTHFDITPSLLALLQGKNFVKRPQVASWIGHGLDNTVSFRSQYTYPFMRNKNEILDLLSGINFLSNRTLYKIFPSMNIEPVDQTENQKQLPMELDNFIRNNNYACRNNKLIPDSLIKWTYSNSKLGVSTKK